MKLSPHCYESCKKRFEGGKKVCSTQQEKSDTFKCSTNSEKLLSSSSPLSAFWCRLILARKVFDSIKELWFLFVFIFSHPTSLDLISQCICRLSTMRKKIVCYSSKGGRHKKNRHLYTINMKINKNRQCIVRNWYIYWLNESNSREILLFMWADAWLLPSFPSARRAQYQ